MKNIKNNSGFSLIELLVSMAILVFIALALSLMLGSGANIFSSVNTTIGIQYDSQTSMSFMEELIVDTNETVKWENGELTLTNSVRDGASDGPHTFSVNEFGLLYNGDKLAPDVIGLDISPELMVDPYHVGEDTADYVVESLTVTLTIIRNEKQYITEQTIALRNKPVWETP